MQTRKLGLRALTLAMAGVLTLGLAACEETKTVAPLQPSVLTISPTGNVDLFVGDRIQIVSNLQNPGANANVAYASSNTAVATVDANGTVEAVAPGISTITATATGNAGETLRAAMTVRVVARDTVPGGTTPGDTAQVIITSVVMPNNDQVDPTNVQGVIFVRTEVERGTAAALLVELVPAVEGGQAITACRQDFSGAATTQLPEGMSAAAAQAEFVCAIETNEFNPETGEVKYRNQTYRIRARLINRDGGTLDQAQTGQLVFRNVDRVAYTASVNNEDGQETATGPDGVIWAGGSVTLTGNAVIFSNADPATAVIRMFTDQGTVVQNVAVAENGTFTATFSEDELVADGGVDNVEDDDVFLTVGNLLDASGQRIFVANDPQATGFQSVEETTVSGEDFFALQFRLDNVPPQPDEDFALLPFTGAQAVFINEDFQFSLTNPRIQLASLNGAGTARLQNNLDAGVDRVSATFYAAAANTSNADLISEANVVSTGADLDDTERDDALRLAVVVRDTLGNDTTIFFQGATTNRVVFGVDTFDPRISFTTASVDDREIENNLAEPMMETLSADFWQVAFSDTLTSGGFTAEPVRARVTRLAAGLTAAQSCGPDVATRDGEDLPGNYSTTAGCRFELTDGQTGVPVLGATGYYTYEAFVVDQAGNVSDTISSTILLDEVLPVVVNTTLPTAGLTAGRPNEVRGDFTDNLDLLRAQLVQVYNASYDADGTTELAFSNGEQIGTAFDATLTRTATARSEDPFVRYFEIYGNGASPAQAVQWRVLDAARNLQDSDPRNLTVTAPAANTAAEGVTAWNITVKNNTDVAETVCNSRTGACSTEPTNVLLTASITGGPVGGASVFNSPFSSVYFYYIDANGNEQFIGRSTSATTEGTTGTRTIRYRFTWDPSFDAGELPDTFEVFAVGVSGAGDALGTANTAAVTVVTSD